MKPVREIVTGTLPTLAGVWSKYPRPLTSGASWLSTAWARGPWTASDPNWSLISSISTLS